MVIRELTTLLGFKIDEDKLRRFDVIVGVTKRRISKLRLELEGIGKTVQRIGAGMTAFITTPLAIAGGMMIKTASDAEETAQKFSVIFRDIIKDADAVAVAFAEDFGLARMTSKELLAGTADLLTGFGFTQEKALDLSNQVQRLGGDLASFQNIEGGAAEAGTKLTKGILGETENLKLLGIAVNQGSKEFRAYVKQIMASEHVTERQAKVLAIFRTAVTQSKNAIGDFARTSQSFANQWKIFREKIKNVAEAFGKILLPMATMFLKVLIKIVDMFDKLPEPIKKVITGLILFVMIMGPVIFVLSTLLLHLGMATLKFLLLSKVLGFFGLTVFGAFSKIGLVFLNLTKYISLLRYAVIWLLKFFGVLLLKVALMIAVMVALSYAIHLVYDDIRVWTEGGDSLIGMLLGSFEKFKQRISMLFDLVKLIFTSFWKAINEDSREEWDKFKALFKDFVLLFAIMLEEVFQRFGKSMGIAKLTMGNFLIWLVKWYYKLPYIILREIGRLLKTLIMFILEDLSSALDKELDKMGNKVNSWFMKKFPKIAKFLLTDEYIANFKSDADKGQQQPGAYIGPQLAGAGAGAGGMNVKIDSNVSLTVPEGTKKEQADYLKDIAQNEWADAFEKRLAQTIESLQQTEK